MWLRFSSFKSNTSTPSATFLLLPPVLISMHLSMSQLLRKALATGFRRTGLCRTSISVGISLLVVFRASCSNVETFNCPMLDLP